MNRSTLHAYYLASEAFIALDDGTFEGLSCNDELRAAGERFQAARADIENRRGI